MPQGADARWHQVLRAPPSPLIKFSVPRSTSSAPSMVRSICRCSAKELSGMPAVVARAAVSSEVGIPMTRRPWRWRWARASSAKAAVEPLPRPTTMPSSTSATAASAAARLRESRSELDRDVPSLMTQPWRQRHFGGSPRWRSRNPRCERNRLHGFHLIRPAAARSRNQMSSPIGLMRAAGTWLPPARMAAAMAAFASPDTMKAACRQLSSTG